MSRLESCSQPGTGRVEVLIGIDGSAQSEARAPGRRCTAEATGSSGVGATAV